ATGIAHYLEHMLFKGTENMGTLNYPKEKEVLDKITATYEKRFSETDPAKRLEYQKQINKLSVEASQYAVPNEIDAIYSSLGSRGLNAYTDSEETVYVVDLPKNRLEQWAKVESERFAKPVFRLFQPELETVYEEKNRTLDNKERLLNEAVEKSLFKVHPYGTQTTLGTVEHLKNPSLSKMYEFYKKYYVPNNMAIFLSGDLDIQQAKEIVTKYFSPWQKKEVAKYEVPQEKPLIGIEKTSVNYKGEEKVVIAFRTVNYKSEDKKALTLIDMLLSNGQAGLIDHDLVYSQKVRSASSYPNFDDDYGAMYFYGIPKTGQTLEQVQELLLAEVEKIKKGQFDESIIPGIIKSLEIGQKSQLESNDGRVGLMKSSFLRDVPLEEVMSFSNQLKSVSKADIINVANKYFGKNYIVAYRYDKDYSFPKIDKPGLEKMKLNTNQKSKFATSVLDINPAPIAPKWVDYNKDFKVDSYAPGVLYYYTKNPLNDIFTLNINYEYGSKHNKDLCYVMDELNNAGVDGMTPEQLKDQLFKMGINISYSCSDYGFSANISGLDSEFEKGVSIAEKILWNAKLNNTHLKEKVKNIIASRVDSKKDLSTLRSALSQYVTYGDKSGYIDRMKNTDLENLSVNEYPEMKNQLAKQNFKLYYSGQLPMQEVENIVKKYHQPQNITVPLLNPIKRPQDIIMTRHNKPVKIYFLNYKGAQAHINLLIPGKQVNPEERLINGLYNEYFDGGMGAILFQEVREARALAYSTSGRYNLAGRLGDQDQMSGYIGTQADKTIEALKLFIDLLKSPPESEQRFERAKSALDNSYRTNYINFRSVAGTVQSWGELGFDKDPRPQFFNQLPQAKFEDVKSFIKNKIASKNLTFMIVGDQTKINMTDLKKIGDVEMVDIETIFKN
ncbi:MAG: insulinase family protein, partial [Candidatus Sericytochromatia bacterium]|nr:insulinase family protein [Candidatus Sericytochromatia bacterium]